MLAANLLAKKRDGLPLSDKEIQFLIEGFCAGDVADYQMSALAMAICVRGMCDRETASLTRAMFHSGRPLSRDASGDRPRVDKHSTGGLGDKVSLILAPLLAACGTHVPMISGRGLGLSGGTLDKLESIDGFCTQLSDEQADRALAQAGTFIIGASRQVAPADRRLYALRDVTGTVESIPLITASILSKKLSASLDALVMDVKVGRAAFMKTLDQARALGQSLERVGRAAGLPTSVLISDMDQPLGKAIGNAIEVNEAVAILQCRGRDDAALEAVRELTIELCKPLLVKAAVTAGPDESGDLLRSKLDDGSAMEHFEKMVASQGGRWQGDLPLAECEVVTSKRSGFVRQIDCFTIGSTVVSIGGGRQTVNDAIDPAVGIELLVRVGDVVEAGQPVLRFHCHRNLRNSYLEGLNRCVDVSESPQPTRPLIVEATVPASP